MKLRTIFLIFLIVACFSCKENHKPLNTIYRTNKKSDLTEDENKSWFLKCPESDTIPGISLEKALNLVRKMNSDSVIVAVVDASFDINHEELKDAIWNNIEEILNFKDDDSNGYIDDLNGWNFIGNSDKKLPKYQNYEFARVLRHYSKEFENSIDTSTTESKERYRMFKKVQAYTEDKLSSVREQLEYGQSLIKNYYLEHHLIKPHLPDSALFTLTELNNIYAANPDLKAKTETLKLLLDYGMTIDDLKEDVVFRERLLNIYYNPDFNERLEIGDNPNDIGDLNYGNNLVDGLKEEISHGTYVSGIIAANSHNKVGIKGIANKAQIMPVVVAVNGEAHDKDLALGIRYAVDNGAKIINISISKEFSLFKEWVFDAIKYAASNDVLIINAAGNDNLNLDVEKNFFPNDSDYNQQEIADNFLMVGGSTLSIDGNLKYEYSNYGNETVDIMAPASNIYTIASNNTYEFVDGTSFSAPIASGVAALLRSYYPDLSAAEVKKILMESGTRYDVTVNVSNGENEKLVPFSSLSKSGKIVNAYNAMLMAGEINGQK